MKTVEIIMCTPPVAASFDRLDFERASTRTGIRASLFLCSFHYKQIAGDFDHLPPVLRVGVLRSSHYFMGVVLRHLSRFGSVKNLSVSKHKRFGLILGMKPCFHTRNSLSTLRIDARQSKPKSN